MVDQISQGRERGFDASVVPDVPFIVQGDVEIDPEENLLAFNLERLERSHGGLF
jgi:hypothetical protein